jgi:ABC-2 type transport system ATP-binding protein
MGQVGAIDIDGLVASYGTRRAVAGLSLQVAEGTTCVLLGPNGAGKTTTLNVLMGLRAADSGRVEVLGRRPGDRALRHSVGVLLQDGGLPVAAKPMAILAHFARMYADPLPVSDVAQRLGIDHLDRPFRRLSGGEQQRVKLAVALVGRPRLLILDEPTTGMDPAARRVFWTMLDDLRSQGVSTLLTTHQPDEAGTRADQIIVIHRGEVVADAPPRALIDRSPVWFTCARHLDVNPLRGVLGEGFGIVEVEPGRYRVTGEVGVREVSAIESWVAGHGDGRQQVTVVRSLEEAYLELTGGSAW